ncbi:hypothetical protein D5086_026502 [Populus alba]|uniref:Uncharacterized protein n=1 Tax=Populus alba TaxID=43335 RepID=A0ACC4B3S1_POPAL
MIVIPLEELLLPDFPFSSSFDSTLAEIRSVYSYLPYEEDLDSTKGKTLSEESLLKSFPPPMRFKIANNSGKVVGQGKELCVGC